MFRNLTAWVLSAALLAGAGAALADGHEDKKRVVTVVTSAEPQTQLMSMVLTMQSMKKGAEVHILLCGPGGDIALKDAPAGATAPQAPKSMSPQGLMAKIMMKGGKVDVCALYLPNKGVGQDALIEGVGVAKPPEMAGELIADNTTVLSF